MSVERVLQAAVYAALAADTTYMALVTGGIHDLMAPAGVSFPYTVIGDITELPAATHDKEGWECTITLHNWTKNPNAKGRKTVQTIRERQNVVLHRAQLTVTGFTLTKMVYEFGQVIPDQDSNGEWAEHGICRYRVNSIAS